MKIGDTVPKLCPKCEGEKWDFLGYQRVTDKLIYRCGRCGYDHYEDTLDRRRAC